MTITMIVFLCRIFFTDATAGFLSVLDELFDACLSMTYYFIKIRCAMRGKLRPLQRNGEIIGLIEIPLVKRDGLLCVVGHAVHFAGEIRAFITRKQLHPQIFIELKSLWVFDR